MFISYATIEFVDWTNQYDNKGFLSW